MTRDEIDNHVKSFLGELWTELPRMRFDGLSGLSDHVIRESLKRLVKAGIAEMVSHPFRSNQYRLKAREETK